MDIRQLTRTLLVKQAAGPAPIQGLPAGPAAAAPGTPPPPVAPEAPGFLDKAKQVMQDPMGSLQGGVKTIGDFVAAKAPQPGPIQLPGSQPPGTVQQGPVAGDQATYFQKLLKARESGNPADVQPFVNQVAGGSTPVPGEDVGRRLATLQALPEAPAGQPDPYAAQRQQLTAAVPSKAPEGVPTDKYVAGVMGPIQESAVQQFNQQAGTHLTPQDLSAHPQAVGIAIQGAQMVGAIKPEFAQTLKTVLGTDRTAQGQMLHDQIKASASKVVDQVAGSMKDGKPDFMGAIMSDPMSLMAPAGLLLMLVGGDMGKLLGGLMLAGGGYRMFTRFQNAANPDTVGKYKQLLDHGVKDFSYQGLQQVGLDPQTVQAVGDFSTLGHVAGQEALKARMDGSVDQMANQFLSPQQQAAQQATEAQQAAQVKATGGAPQ